MDLTGAAQSIVGRLRAAEQSCRANYVNPHREAPTLPIVRELAELVLTLTVEVDRLQKGQSPCRDSSSAS